MVNHYPIGKELGGYEGKNKIYFKDGNERSYVYKRFVEEDGITRDYRSYGVNVRDSFGNKLGYLKKGSKVRGTRNGALIEIIYKGKRQVFTVSMFIKV